MNKSNDFKQIFKEMSPRDILNPERTIHVLQDIENLKANTKINEAIQAPVQQIRTYLSEAGKNKIRDVIELHCGTQIQFFNIINKDLEGFLDTLDIIYFIKDKYIFIENS